MKRYILPLILIVIGSFLFLFGGRQVADYYASPWTHFTGVCTTMETPTGCPKEAAETNKRLSETPEAFVNRLWTIGSIVGFVAALVGIVIGLYRLIAGQRHSKSVTKAKS